GHRQIWSCSTGHDALERRGLPETGAVPGIGIGCADLCQVTRGSDNIPPLVTPRLKMEAVQQAVIVGRRADTESCQARNLAIVLPPRLSSPAGSDCVTI